MKHAYAASFAIAPVKVERVAPVANDARVSLDAVALFVLRTLGSGFRQHSVGGGAA